MATPPQRRHATVSLIPSDVFRDPESLTRTEKKVVAAVKTPHEVTLSWQWQDVHGVWHFINRDHMVNLRGGGKIVLNFRCVGLEDRSTAS